MMNERDREALAQKVAAEAFPGEYAFSSCHWKDQDDRLWSVTVGPFVDSGWHTVWVWLADDGSTRILPECFSPQVLDFMPSWGFNADMSPNGHWEDCMVFGVSKGARWVRDDPEHNK